MDGGVEFDHIIDPDWTWHPSLGVWNSKKRIEINEVNWISGEEPEFNKKYSARIRYRQKLQNCVLEKKDSQIFVNFEEEQKTASAGQSIVLYDGNVCLGGGVIK